MHTVEQQKAIDIVIDYIEKNLESTLSLQTLAAVSTYSPYHFQRIFKAAIGETPANYIKRLRMEKAAHLLIYEYSIPVTQIALICGFSSLSYFTSSFQTYFEMSPSKWREGGYLQHFPREYADHSKISKLNRNMQQEKSYSTKYNRFQWLNLEKVKVTEFPVCTTVKRQSIGSYTQGIPEVWEDLYRLGSAHELIEKTSLLFGIPKNNPYITPPEKSRYECHLAISSKDAIKEENLSTFAGGKHVVYEFEEAVEYENRKMLIECYSELYSFWLPRSGYKYLDNPIELVELTNVQGSLEVRSKIKAIALAIEPK